MSEATRNMFTCDACGQQFRWKPELAGKRVKCPCGQVMTAPLAPPVPAEAPASDMYDLADSPPPQRRAPFVPVVPASTTATATPPARASTQPADDLVEKMRDIYVPLLLLGVGVVIDVVAAWMRGAHGAADFRVALLALGIGTIGGTIIMLVALFITARIRGIKLGSLPTAALKLAALYVAPGALVSLIAPLLAFILFFGWFIGLGIEFVLYFTLLGYFFDLDESDTWYCIAVIFVVAVATAVATMWLPALLA